MKHPDKLELDFDLLANNFNFVAGLVYRREYDDALVVPLHHGIQHYVCDCVVFRPGQAFNEAEIEPVRAEDIVKTSEYRPEVAKYVARQYGRSTDVPHSREDIDPEAPIVPARAKRTKP